MKSIKELHEILSMHGFGRVDAHIHTHVCDGAADMTVENIAIRAKQNNIGAVILTPHFHKQVSDDTETLYTDSDETVFLALRDEIDCYSRHGDVQFLLSTEVDILSVDGALSLAPSAIAEKALDLITPTMNYNPILPFCMVHLTYGKDIDGLHESGQYACMAQEAGGISTVLEAMYESEANALLKSPYPSMLGHFFAAHSIANDLYSWFGTKEEHLTIMRAGSEKVIEACKRRDSLIDITGIHLKNETFEHKRQKDGFLFDFQKEFIHKCNWNGILVFPGTDAHELGGVGNISYYREVF